MATAYPPLTRDELSSLTAENLAQLDSDDLLGISAAVAMEDPHPHRPLGKWEKCLDRTGRISDGTSMLRKNVLRTLRIAKLPDAHPLRKRRARHIRHALTTQPMSVPGAIRELRGGLNHNGPLIPDDVAEAALHPAERSLEFLFDSLEYDL